MSKFQTLTVRVTEETGRILHREVDRRNFFYPPSEGKRCSLNSVCAEILDEAAGRILEDHREMMEVA